MSKSIERVAAIILISFGIIGLALGYWQVVRAGDLLADPSLNRARLYEEERRIVRGKILDRDGEVLARTEMTDDGTKRVYTAPWLVHVIGHYSLRYGNTNVEQYDDQYLRGKLGVDPASAVEDRLLHRPIQGNDVVLTIDNQLQKVAEEALGTSRGSIIAMDPRTGEILALASHPYYDPNNLEDNWTLLTEDPATPLLNRATQGLYAPGSTFKTVTAAAAVDSGTFSLDDRFEFTLSPGNPPAHSEAFHGFSVYCGNHINTGPGKLSIDLAGAFSSSCNVAFAELGVRLGHQRLTDYAGRFGFGSEIPTEMSSVASQISTDPKFLRDDAALASTAFGQGQLLVSPMQIALVTNAVANKGVIMQPRVVKEVRREQRVVEENEASVWRTPIQAATADAIRSMMVGSVDHGWATAAQIPGVQVAGKTGTAETGDQQATHAWFTAFAPASNPTISVTVIKEHAGFGSTEAIPAAKAILEAALASHPSNHN